LSHSVLIDIHIRGARKRSGGFNARFGSWDSGFAEQQRERKKATGREKAGESGKKCFQHRRTSIKKRKRKDFVQMKTRHSQSQSLSLSHRWKWKFMGLCFVREGKKGGKCF